MIAPKLSLLTTTSINLSQLEYTEQKSQLDALSQNKEFYALWHLGKITKSYLYSKEDVSIKNLKKSIISLFQYQLLDGEYEETDVAGTCTVLYSSKSNSIYEKKKTKCKHTPKIRQRLDKPVGVSVVSSRTAEFKVTQDGTLEKIECQETHHFSIVANKRAGSSVESTISLKFDGSISNIQIVSAGSAQQAVQMLKGVKEQSLKALSPTVTPDSEEVNLSKFALFHKD